MRIEFYKHGLGEEEKQKVLECLNGTFLTAGSYVKEFEQEFAKYLNLKCAVGLNSCTAALHLSLLALGIGEGDEVLTTPMTFIATATSIMHSGAKPVFVDVEPDTALIDHSRIERAITEKTKAIIPVHLYGQMCNMRKIVKIADNHNLKIIEDAAHCIEGEREGVRPGYLSDIACFSFYATKNITSGEGGAIATNDRYLAEKIMILRQHGMSKEAEDRYSGNYQHWDMVECGWKYNMDNIQASLLLPQLKHIDKSWQMREELYKHYTTKLRNISQIELPKIKKYSKSAYHLLTIWVTNQKRDFILRELCKRGIGVAVNYRAIHLLKYFKERFAFKKGDYQVAEKIGNSTISLPFYPKITINEIECVIECLNEILTLESIGVTN